MYELNSSLKERINFNNSCNFQFIKSNIEGNIGHLKLPNSWVAKKLMSHTFFVEFWVFRREFLQNHSVYWAQIFRDNWNYCYALSVFSEGFILLASSDNDEYILTTASLKWRLGAWAQLFEGRLALNPQLNLTLISFSWVQKHFVG